MLPAAGEVYLLERVRAKASFFYVLLHGVAQIRGDLSTCKDLIKKIPLRHAQLPVFSLVLGVVS